jgi:glucokinase
MSGWDNAVLVIDAGGTYFKSALMANSKEGCKDRWSIIEESRYSIRVDSKGMAEAIRNAYQGIVAKQLENAKRNQHNILGVSVDTPGPFDFDRCVSKMKHKFEAIYDIPLKPWIQEIAGNVPICFIHDSAAFMQGEAWMGEAQGYKNSAGVMLGTGLGLACMKDGTILSNVQKGPAIPLYSKPYLDGTAEDYISRRGIIRRYREQTQDGSEGLDVVDVARKALSGDLISRRVFEETGRMLGEVLKPVLEELGTQCLVLGGQISKSYSLFEKSLKESVKELDSLDRIYCSANPDDSHLLGCGKAFLDQYKTKK